ncbi:MAG: hypothetical protein Q4Q03_00480 [Bowdeniella nasicola]|nr:hypothetical protein [Bowdeniella nasicola]
MTWILLALLTLTAGLIAGASLPSALIGTAITAVPIIAGAVGIVVIYRTNKIINLAQIQLASLAATVFASLVGGAKILIATHDVCACLTFVPTARARLVNMGLAALVTLVAAAVLWWALHALIVTRFFTSPLLGTSASAFVAIGLAGLGPLARDGLVSDVDLSLGRAQETWQVPLAAHFHVAGRDVSSWQLLTTVLVIAIICAFIFALHHTRWGRQLRAVADHAPRAATLGISAFRIGGRSWILAGLLAACVGIAQVMADPRLPAPMDASQAGTTLQTAPLLGALAAAAIAQFQRLPRAVIAAIVWTFTTQALTVRFATSAPADACAVIIVGIALATTARTRTRTDAGEGLAVASYQPIAAPLAKIDRIARLRTLAWLLPVLVLVVAPLLLTPGRALILASILCFAILTCSCYLQTGLGALPALGQVGIATAGGWLVLATSWPLPLALVAATGLGALIAMALTMSALRLDGMQIAVFTLVFAISAQAFFRDPNLAGGLITSRTPTMQLGGMDLGDARIIYLGALITLLVTLLLIHQIRTTPLGRGLIALRDNPPAAQALGLAPGRYRLTLAAISGGIAALGGTWLVYLAGNLTGSAFTPERSLSVFLYTVLGGLGGPLGALLGATLFGLLEFLGTSSPQLATALAGFGGLALLAATPSGLAGAIMQARDNALVKFAYRHHIALPALMGDGGLAAMRGKIPLDDKRAPLRGANDPALPRYALAAQPLRQGSDDDHT